MKPKKKANLPAAYYWSPSAPEGTPGAFLWKSFFQKFGGPSGGAKGKRSELEAGIRELVIEAEAQFPDAPKMGDQFWIVMLDKLFPDPIGDARFVDLKSGRRISAGELKQHLQAFALDCEKSGSWEKAVEHALEHMSRKQHPDLTPGVARSHFLGTFRELFGAAEALGIQIQSEEIKKLRGC